MSHICVQDRICRAWGDHVFLGNKSVTMAYNVVVVEDWDLDTTNEYVNASDPAQEEEDNAFFV